MLEALELPLLRVLGPEVAEVFADLHREHGVDLRTSVACRLESAGGGPSYASATAPSLTRPLVVGVGVVAQQRARGGRRTQDDNGIVVDEHLRTSDPRRVRRR